MEEEVNNVNNTNNVKKSGTSGVGTFFFLVVVVAIIVASLICGILEYNYYMESRINNLQSQINELKKINSQMDENYRDAISINAEPEEGDEIAETTTETTAETSAETAVETTNETTNETTANTVE